MIKSHFTDLRFDGHGFVNHIHHCIVDCGVVPGTTAPLIEAYQVELIQNMQATSGTGGKPRNIALFRKVISDDPSAGAWQFLEMWEEGIAYTDSSAAGSVAVDPISGAVHISMSFGQKNAAGAVQYQPWEASVPRSAFAAPIERLPVGEVGPPGPPGPAGAGGIVLFGAPVAHAAWDGRQLNGGETVDVPAVFGVPSSNAYLIRFVAQASATDVRVRAGTAAAPYFLTMNLTVANMQQHIQGWAPGPQMFVSTVNGTAQVWLQIVGMSG